MKDNINLLKQLLIPYDTFDNNSNKMRKMRLGVNSDGGYVVSQPVFEKHKHILSIGISNEYSFDKTCAALDKQVYMYDGSITSPKDLNLNMFFINKNIYGSLEPEILALKLDFLADDMLLKMDVDGWEYDILLNTDLPRFFSQITFEIHGLLDEFNKDWTDNKELQNKITGNFQIKKDVFNKLTDDFTLIHIHQNNHSKNIDGFHNCIELTYIRNNEFCEKEVRREAFPESGVDYPNNPRIKDRTIKWW